MAAKLKHNFSSLIFYLSILFFTIGFNFSDTMVGNWTQQFMPNLGGKVINDITFLDSLTGFAIASKNVNPDTSSILKTTNGGDNWQIVLTQSSRRFNRIQFINSQTGFICGGTGTGTPYLYKTTDSGSNWTVVSTLGCALWKDMAVLNSDTIWLADDNSLCGGVYFTTNGGSTWANQFAGGNQNPNKIYMFNARIGFHSNQSGIPNIYKTTNSGTNWTLTTGGEYFRDMYFVDSLTGWRAFGNNMYKTTNGGNNWATQILPTGGNIVQTAVFKFSNINKDTIWGVGGAINTSLGIRGILYHTTNEGTNWLFQLPDTTIQIPIYYNNEFVSRLSGWAYNTVPTGIHTTNGGDTSFLLPVTQISNEIPNDYILFQNYPNPFNPKTKIKYQITKNKNVMLRVYNITGKEIITLVNQKQTLGTYEIDFDGSKYSSGVYFYSLYADGKLVETKKMLLVK